ncbi:hypothetical protein [Gelidibacter japonicus]|uniref:hypothetical protein n=1 Tax=Gelidibacter japonicus TaxID=1962232 RepID=UPI003A8E8942
MNTKYLFILILLVSTTENFAQKINPDTEVLSAIIQEKQKELKKRVLNNVVVKNIKTTNYSTYNTIYNLMRDITTEKNKTVMSKSIIKEIANYSINYALANYFIFQLKENKDSSSFITNENEWLANAINKSDLSDRNYLALYLSAAYHKEKKADEKNKSGKNIFDEQVEKEEHPDYKKLTHTANFIIDSLYAKLSRSDIPALTKNNLYLKTDYDKRFSNSLNIEYNSDTVIDFENLNSKLNIFVEELKKFDTISNLIKKYCDLKNEIEISSSIDITNLNSLSKNDVKALFSLFSFALSDYKNEIGNNHFIYKIGRIIETYVIYEENNGEPLYFKEFKIDVEAIILALEDQFYKNKITSIKNWYVGIEPFFIIGLNYGILPNEQGTIMSKDNSESISDIAYVGEKIGLKVKLFDFGYTRSHKPMEWYKYRRKNRRWLNPVPAPLINDVYLMVYGSGILYNVLDLKSEENFNFALAAAGFGVSFFNDLEVNISYAIPYIDKSFSQENALISLGVDIPIFEYIKALSQKN